MLPPSTELKPPGGGETHPRSFSVFGLGTVVVDHQAVMNHFPEADTKGEVLADRYQVGGPVPTALCLLRRWGCRTLFQGKWAQDWLGSMIEMDLRAQEIDFDPPASPNDSRTGFAHVWVEQSTGRRTVAAYRGSHVIEPQELRFEALATCDALHLDGWSGAAAIEAAQFMKEKRGKVFLDLGSPKNHLNELLPLVDFVNCPARLVHRLFHTEDLELGARRLLELGPSEITVTLGGQGALHFSEKQRLQQKAFPIKAVDTTGAGDVFAGAMIFSTLQGWPAQQKLRFAGAAAALKCQALGNREALPTLDEIQNFLSSNNALAGSPQPAPGTVISE